MAQELFYRLATRIERAPRTAADREAVLDWDVRMRRAFKGILPSPARHAYLARSIARLDREG